MQCRRQGGCATDTWNDERSVRHSHENDVARSPEMISERSRFQLQSPRMTKFGEMHQRSRVMRTSNALDLEPDVFTLNSPRQIAASLKRSAERSHRRKSTPFRSAMSMLTFYINRAGSGLDDDQRKILERAKDELRDLFNKPRKE